MAGQGMRLRPHTLIRPKPLINLAGKTIIQRLLELINNVFKNNIKEIIFIIGDVDKKIENTLLYISKKIKIKCLIYRQKKPLGTAHSLLCAQKALQDGEPVIIVYSDTLFFNGDFNLNIQADGIIWTKKIRQPKYYGVVKCDDNGYVTKFIEKPKKLISNFAIIGMYFIKNSKILKQELEKLIKKKDKQNKEYQLTKVLDNMRKKGVKFINKTVDQWMDCGDKYSIIKTNHKILQIEKNQNLFKKNIYTKNSLIIEPCFINDTVKIQNSKIGPYVSIDKNTVIKNSNIKNSVIQKYSKIINANFCDSIIGNNVLYKGMFNMINLGDYSVIDIKKS